MRHLGSILLVILSITPAALGQVTRVATFENFAAGQSFKPSFTDPVSGITFRDSTQPPTPGGFVIDFSPSYFGSGNYLTSGAIGVGAMGSLFGFTADLPSAANSVSVDAIYTADTRSHVALQALNSLGTVVAQQSGPSGLSADAFALQVTSSQFDIVSFKIAAGGGFAAYDNIAITVAPEPAVLAVAVCAGLIAFRPTRRIYA